MTTPVPDPAPGTHGKVTIVPYRIVLPAVDVRGRIIPGLFFRCYIPVRGKQRCVEFWRGV